MDIGLNRFVRASLAALDSGVLAGLPDLGAALAGPPSASATDGATALEHILAAGNPWRPKQHPGKPAAGAATAQAAVRPGAPARSAAEPGPSGGGGHPGAHPAAPTTPAVPAPQECTPPLPPLPPLQAMASMPIAADWGGALRPPPFASATLQPDKAAQQHVLHGKVAVQEAHPGGPQGGPPVITSAGLQLLMVLRDYSEMARCAAKLFLRELTLAEDVATPDCNASTARRQAITDGNDWHDDGKHFVAIICEVYFLTFS